MREESLICGHCDNEIVSGDRCFAKTNRGPRFHEACWQIVDADEIEQDRKCDRWHNGYFAKTEPTDPDEHDGWMQARHDAERPSVIVQRPEGYYHQPLGTFD